MHTMSSDFDAHNVGLSGIPGYTAVRCHFTYRALLQYLVELYALNGNRNRLALCGHLEGSQNKPKVHETTEYLVLFL